MARCDPNHLAPVRLARVLVRIDVPHASTMTRRGTTKPHFAKSFRT